MRENRFQIEVATGRFTLPVVILICLILWAMTIQEWSDLGSLFIIISIGYLMIKANTAFTLIRTRTSLPVCIYWILATSLFFLHPFEWSHLIPLTFLIAVLQLFNAYESSKPAAPIYNVFLTLGASSLLFPKMIYFIPLFFFSMIPFRAISFKSLWACLLGLLTSYWFLFGYAIWNKEMNLFIDPIKEMITFSPISYGDLPINAIISWVVITLFLLISSVHYWHISYTDKTRTRIYHFFLVNAGWWTTLLILLQPQHFQILMPIQCICAGFLGGHLFTLTRNRFSGILFIVTFASVLLTTVYNLWMQYFNS